MGYRHVGEVHMRLPNGSCIIYDSAPTSGCPLHVPGSPGRCDLDINVHYMNAYLDAVRDCARQAAAFPVCVTGELPLL